MNLIRQTRYLAGLLALWLLQLAVQMVDNPLRDLNEAAWAAAASPAGRLWLALMLIEAVRQMHRSLRGTGGRYARSTSAFGLRLITLWRGLPRPLRLLKGWAAAGFVALEVAAVATSRTELEVLAEVGRFQVGAWPPLAQGALAALVAGGLWQSVAGLLAAEAIRVQPLEAGAIAVRMGDPSRLTWWRRLPVVARLRRLAGGCAELLLIIELAGEEDPAPIMLAAEELVAAARLAGYPWRLADWCFDLRLPAPARATFAISVAGG